MATDAKTGTTYKGRKVQMFHGGTWAGECILDSHGWPASGPGDEDTAEAIRDAIVDDGHVGGTVTDEDGREYEWTLSDA